jgi:hypothetical protein
MWYAVMVAFCRAIMALKTEQNGNLDCYKNLTSYLSVCAILLNEKIENIHDWIDKEDYNYVKDVLIPKREEILNLPQTS